MRDRAWTAIGLIGALAGCNGEPVEHEKVEVGEFSVRHADTALELIATDKADILFVIDNSGSMREEQVALRQQFSRLLTTLTSGDVDGDGEQEFPPLQSVRLGVVSTDLGLPGIEGIPQCDGLGDDGILQHTPMGDDAASCAPSYPEFLSYERGGDANLNQVASDLGCIGTLGTDGCGFEQQLEAALKASWPASDDRIAFLGDPATGAGTQGQGDTANGAFFETDADDPSLLMVVLVTDEEDCSSPDSRIFSPPQFLDPADPLATQDLNLRCFHNKASLYDVQRYVDALRELRPGHPERVVFGVIAGVPPDLVSAEARAEVDFDDDDARNAYYDGILADEDMQEVVDPNAEPGAGNLKPSCTTIDSDPEERQLSRAYPPRRLVEVARRFGPNGFVHSICQSDFGPAIDALMGHMAGRMAP